MTVIMDAAFYGQGDIITLLIYERNQYYNQEEVSKALK